MSSDKSFIISSMREINIQHDPMKKLMNADQTRHKKNALTDSMIKSTKYRNGVFQSIGSLDLKVKKQKNYWCWYDLGIRHTELEMVKRMTLPQDPSQSS